MSVHFSRDIDRLKKQILHLGAMVEDNLRRAVKAILERDALLAREVVKSDFEVDRMEVEIEEECLKVLALHQPVATDLRFVVSILKINNDLERIGDLAVNIAERAEYLAQKEPTAIPYDLRKMVACTQSMLKRSLDSLVERNIVLAYEVCAADEEVDKINRAVYPLTTDSIQQNPEITDVLLHLLTAARQLERIADHATNIAEDVIYMLEGRIVRHQPDKYAPYHA